MDRSHTQWRYVYNMSKQQKIDLKKYKAWSPLSNDPANVEYNNMYTRFLKYWKPSKHTIHYTVMPSIMRPNVLPTLYAIEII